MTEANEKGSRRGRGARRLAGLAILLLLASAAYFLGGFVRFAHEVASLSAPSSVEEADGIVVLTGGSQRIERGLELLRHGEGRRLLISGVNPRTGVESLTRLTGGNRDLFECCVDLDYEALNTVGNAEMAALWARQHGLQRLILVTSDYHVPRSMIEMERVDDAPAVTAYPVTAEKLWRADGLPSGLGIRLLVTEYAKVLAARARIALGLPDDGARTHQFAARHEP